MQSRRIPADQIRNWTADIHQIAWILEQLKIAVIPGDQIHVGIHDADALRHVLHRSGEQLAAEAQLLRGFVQ